MSQDELYRRWIERSRAENVPEGFSDRVMASIAEHEVGRSQQREQHVLMQILLAVGASRLGRCAACLGALLLGMAPYFYVAYLAAAPVY